MDSSMKAKAPANDLPSRNFALSQHRSLQFWLTVIAFACISLLVVLWGAASALGVKGSEKLLRIGFLLPKLKSNQGDRKADAFRMSEPEPSESAPPKDRKIAVPPAPPPGAAHVAAVIESPKVMIAAVEQPAPLPPQPAPVPIPKVDTAPAGEPPSECRDPAVYVKPCSPQRGDSPMMRTWKTLTMYSLLTAAGVVLAPPPMFAGDAKKDASAKVEGIDDLKKSVDELIKRVAALENKKLSKAEEDALAEIFRTELNKLGIADLKKDITALQTELLKQRATLDAYKLQIDELNKKVQAGGAGTPAVDKAFMDELRELRSQFKALADSIAKLGPTTDKRMYPPNGTPTTGRVVIVNLYGEDLLFIVNGVGHRVPAKTTVTLPNIAAGTVRYEVVADRWGLVERQSVTLVAGETFTLTASNPR